MWSGRRRRKRGGGGGAGNGTMTMLPLAASRWRVAARVVYIGGATLLTCALLLEGIFVRLLLVPYLREAKFTLTQCHLRNTFYETRAGLQRCESRCAKLISSFPCLVVRVRFKRSNDGPWHTGYLFDQIISFQKREPFFCSMRPCHLHKERNALTVRSFNLSLTRSRTFPCYLHENTVILKKLTSFSTTTHALLWPAFTALLSALLLLLNWRLFACRVWRETGSALSTPTASGATSIV